MRPDAIPVQVLASRAVLPPDAVASLFGAGATLRPSATVVLVRNGREVARVAVETGPALALPLDRTDAVGDAVRIQGPVGASELVTTQSVRSRLVLPGGLRRAWGVADGATLDLGGVAVTVDVADGTEAVAEIERAAWLAAGSPETAQWLPGVDLSTAAPNADVDDGVVRIERRVVTETDVRQARLSRRRILLSPGQIVTPSARSMAREWDVFADG